MRAAVRLIAGLCVCGAVSAEPAGVRCDGTRADLVGASEAERGLICSASAGVEAFLRRCQLGPRQDYRVAVRSGITGYYGQSLLGRFHPSLQQAEITPLAESAALVASIEADAPMSAYRELDPSDLYRSIAAHEIAHAITHQNMTPPASLLAHEYVSAVVQIELLPTAVRESYLGRFRELKEAPDAILNDLVLAMDPSRFGVAAFHHFHRAGNGCAFLSRFMKSGAAMRPVWP